jgi:hypothetical protein
MDKVMVVLTDNDNQMLVESYKGSLVSPYTAYESHTALGVTATGASSATNAAKAELDARTRNVCSAVKAKGIIVYTITFGSSLSTAARNLMLNCATKPSYYFHSPDNATLRTVFQSIGSQLSNLRITR